MSLPWIEEAFTRQQIAQWFAPIDPWDHQIDGVDQTLNALQHNQTVTLCSQTGSGKSYMASALIQPVIDHEWPATLLTNRRLLTRQSSRNLTASGLDFGVRAASMPEAFDNSKLVQISSIQTEVSRCLDSGRWTPHPARLAILDEAHLYAQGRSLEFIQQLIGAGCKIVLMTATPLGLSHLTPNLVVAASTSQLRKCGALVPAIVKRINEMDISRVRRVKESYDIGQFVAECWSHQVVGKIYEDWVRFNPDRRMTLVFAPGVPESRSLAHYFAKRGAKAAHIDANEVWVRGEYYRDNTRGDVRAQLLDDWAKGDIEVVCNCEVLREGIDLKSLYHLILARPINSFKDFVQICGRVLRKSDATPDHVMITDHVGATWQFGSPNQDIDWHALYALDDKSVREYCERKRDETPPEEVPAACPKCGTLVRFGRCPPPPIGCGEEISKNNPRKLRFIHQKDGTLVTMRDEDLKPKKRMASTDSAQQKAWNQMFWSARKSKSQRGITFKQAVGLMRRKLGRDFSPEDLYYTPREPLDFNGKNDWDRRIRDISFRELKTKIKEV